MARRRTSMKKIREVIRLKSTTTLSDRQIARALNISRPVVAKYWRGFAGSDLSFYSIEDIPDSTLVEAIEKPRVEATGKYQELCQYFPYFITEPLYEVVGTPVAGRFPGEPFVNPLCRVALFPPSTLIFFKPLINQGLMGIEP